MAVTEKRPLDESVYSTKHIVLDIEGTTTSISFVKDTLFPYVRQNLEVYLSSHWDEDEFKDVLSLLKDQAAEDKKANMEGAVEIPCEASNDDMKAALVKNVLWQMDGDRKTKALKKLQGHMWRQGYKTGELKGHLFADVAPALKQWVKDGRKLYIYSSGSVEAQKLLFGNSNDGDLTELFTDFFDTEVGAKVEAESYKSILQKIDCNADDVLFLTDMPKEASAARQAGLPVVLVERDGNEPIASELRKEFSAVSSFQELSFETPNKKQKVDSTADKEDTKPESVNVNGKSNGQSAEAMEVELEDNQDSKANGEGIEKPEAKADDMVVEEEKNDSKVINKVEHVSDSGAKEDVTEKEQENKDKKVEMKEETKMDIAIVKDAESSGNSKDIELPKDLSNTEEKKEDVVEKEVLAVVKTSESLTVEPNKTTTDPSEVIKNDDSEKTDEKNPQLKTEEEVNVIPAKDLETVETDLVNSTSKDDKTDVVPGNIDEEKESKLVEPETVGKVEVVEIVDKVENKTEKENKDDSVKENEVTDVVESEKEKGTEEVKVSEVTETPEKILVSGEVEPKGAELEVEKEVVKTEDPSENSSNDAEEKEKLSDESKSKVSEVVGKKSENEDEKGKEVMNGVSNGTNGSEAGNNAGTNGTVENGHGKEEKDIPEVIVAKNAPQIENSADGVVVEV